MDLRFIAENYRSFPRTAIEDWVLSEILTAIFKNVVPLELEGDVSDLLDRNRIAVYSMFEFYYGSSRACQLHVLTVDDKLVGFASRFGEDAWRGTSLDNAHLAVVAVDLATAAIKRGAGKFAPVDLDERVNIVKFPLRFLDAEQTMFVIPVPRSVYRLHEVPARHRTFFVDGAGRAHQVASIGEFKQKDWVDGKPPKGCEISVVVNNEERVVDATQLLYELVPGQGNLEAALTHYNQPHSWTAVLEAANVNRLRVSITTPRRWEKRDVWVQFYSDADREKFMKNFPVGQVNAGEFTAAHLGTEADFFPTE